MAKTEKEPNRNLEKEVDMLTNKLSDTRKAVCLLAEQLYSMPLPTWRHQLDEIHRMVQDL